MGETRPAYPPEFREQIADAESGPVLQAADPDVSTTPATDARLFGVLLRVVRDL